MRARTVIIISVLCALVLISTGCTSDKFAFIDEGAAYDADSAIALLESSDSGRLARESTSSADRLRQKALTALRNQSDTAADAARTITRSFPRTAASVPFRVERATFDNTDCWVILEASGRSGGRLSDRRLWVLSAEGDVLLFASR